MAEKFSYFNGRALTWPSRCVVCGSISVVTTRARGIDITGTASRLIPISFRCRKSSVLYPVCSRHRSFSWFVGCLFLFSLCTFTAAAGVLFSGSLVQPDEKDLYLLLVTFFGLGSLLAYWGCRAFAPVSILSVGDHFTTILIRNDSYAGDFERLNRRDLFRNKSKHRGHEDARAKHRQGARAEAGDSRRTDQSRANQGQPGGAPKTDPARERESRYAKVLGITERAAAREIKKAYRELVAKYHPDKLQHLGGEFLRLAEAKSKEINQAYEFFRKKHNF